MHLISEGTLFPATLASGKWQLFCCCRAPSFLGGSGCSWEEPLALAREALPRLSSPRPEFTVEPEAPCAEVERAGKGRDLDLAPTSCTRQLAAASSAGPPPLSFPLFFFFGQGFFGAGASGDAFAAGVLESFSVFRILLSKKSKSRR